jgi:hypothetical protein
LQDLVVCLAVKLQTVATVASLPACSTGIFTLCG